MQKFTDNTNNTDNIAKQTVSLNIPTASPYDWQYFLDFQSKRLIKKIEHIQGERYQRTIEIAGIKGDFSIQPCANHFQVYIAKSFLPVLPAVIKRISSIFDLETNTSFIEAQLRTLYPALKISPGLHIPGVASPYEAGIRAICGQQVSVTAANKLLNQFVDIFSQTQESTACYFPAPHQVTQQGLAQMKMMQSKKNTLWLFSQWCCEHDIYSDIDTLIQLKGIGIWTLNYIKLRAMNEPDIFMGTDLGIKKIIEKHELPDIHAAAPWKSYLTLHLWNNL